MGIFQVYRRNTLHFDRIVSDYIAEKVEVFDIKRDKNGYPHFLIFSDGEWKYESAKHFIPNISDEDNI